MVKVGDSKTGPSGCSYTVIKVRKDSVDVKVERLQRDKNGELKTVTNERTVPRDIWGYFVNGYRT